MSNYQVLARKWRPKKFQDVIGQEHITRSLQNAINRNRLGHAYIMSGTRGIGKTSVARIFAKSLRCENKLEDGNSCNTCGACLDFDTSTSMNVIEIDGASNNSVDDIRELISNVHYLPTTGEYKIYIIDEVHMLSSSAFNALLKTLEEPPAHVIFIMATTEPEKLLGTVLSRCQRFDFRNATIQDLSTHIKMISESEGIKFENDELIRQIALQGKGSVRDTLSLFDQVLSFCEDQFITEETLVISLGLARSSAIKTIIGNILVGNTQEVSTQYRTLLSENVSIKNIISEVLNSLFFVIENISNEQVRSRIDNLTKEDWDNISMSELFWIYETIAKDSIWVLDTLEAESVFEIVLQKISLRREFFKSTPLKKKVNNCSELRPMVTPEVKEDATILAKEELTAEPKTEIIIEVKKEEPVVEIKEELVVKAKEEEPAVEVKKEERITPDNFDKTWDGFLAYLAEISMAQSSNLEQGNITSPLQYDDKSASINLGFGLSGKVFYDYLNTPEVITKISDHLASFFNVDVNEINLNLELLDHSEFVSKADIKQKKVDAKLEKAKEEFLEQDLIINAQKLFNTKIEKVIIDNI